MDEKKSGAKKIRIQIGISQDWHHNSSCQVTFRFGDLFSTNNCVCTTCVASQMHQQQKKRLGITTVALKYYLICVKHRILVSNLEMNTHTHTQNENVQTCKFNDVRLVCDKRHEIKLKMFRFGELLNSRKRSRHTISLIDSAANEWNKTWSGKQIQ